MGYRLFATVMLSAVLLVRIGFAEEQEVVGEPELSYAERYQRAMESAQASMRSANETIVSTIAAYEARLAAEAAAREAAEAAAREAAALAAAQAADSATADTTRKTPQPAPVTYTLTVTNNPTGGGTVSRNPDHPRYIAGTRVVMTAVPAKGYRFVRWTNPAGRTVSENPNLGGTMDRNMVLTANFEAEPKPQPAVAPVPIVPVVPVVPPSPAPIAVADTAVADTTVKAVVAKDTAAATVDTTVKPVVVTDTTAAAVDTTVKAVATDTTAVAVDTTVKVVVTDTTKVAVDTTVKAVVKDTTAAVDTTAAAPAAPPVQQTAPTPPPRQPRTSEIFVPEIEMVFVKGGRFRRGCMSDDNSCIADERPAHEVRLNNFRIGKYPVTQKQWGAVMGVIPSHFEGDDLPVEQVSWNEVQEFIRRLNVMTGKRYRLPTEAEWEYAARGGAEGTGQRFWGHRFLDDVAWHDYNSGGRTQPVGTKAPNELGLHDMMGNVWEWVGDWYDRFYYRNSPLKNPAGPRHGSERVYRGQSFRTEEHNCRISMRNYNNPDHKAIDLGFRLVLVE